MRVFIVLHFNHFLFVAVLFSRLGDIGTTWLASPKLKLEANPVARKLGWRYAWLTLLLSFVAYYSTAVAVVILTTSLLVTASNASKIWLARTLGEEEIDSLSRKAMAKSGLRSAIFFNLLPAIFYTLLGGMITLFYPNGQWGFYIALGFFTYAFAIATFYPIRYLRLYKELKESV
jgi:hypothetical protein